MKKSLRNESASNKCWISKFFLISSGTVLVFLNILFSFILVTYSATGSTISQNVSYIVNPNYPRYVCKIATISHIIVYTNSKFVKLLISFSSNYAPTSTPNTVSYTINKCSCGKSKEPKLKNSKYSVFRCL